MKELGIEKATLGIRYLMKYADKPNSAYFPVIKDTSLEIKLWCLKTLFCNNMDDLWESVPDFIFEDIFLMKRIKSLTGVLDYGRGYFSNSTLSFREQFKMIRDKLAHQDFAYQDGMVFINDKGHTSFDLLWLEKLVLSTIASTKNTFKKGMNDIAVFSLMPKGKSDTLDFEQFWNSGFIRLYKITLLTSNQQAIADFFSQAGIAADHFTFDLVFYAVKYRMGMYRIPSQLDNQDFLIYIYSIFRDVEKYFGNFIKLELVPNPDFTLVFEDPAFQQMSFDGKLQYLINKMKLNSAYYGNSIISQALFDVLNLIQADTYQADQFYILKDAKDFLMKVYANILFSTVYVTEDYNTELKEVLFHQYHIDTHFIHARNVYKDYLRNIRRSLDEVTLYQGSQEQKTFLLGLFHHYTSLLDDAENNRHDKRIFSFIRNAVTHDQIEIGEEQVKFYINGRNIHLPHFNKKKGIWTSRDFKNNRVIWEMIINKEEFLHLMDKLYEFADIPTSINISKYVRRKNKG